MKVLLVFALLSVIGYSQAGFVPASTTLIRHLPATIAYNGQSFAPVAYSYGAPLAYAHQPWLASAHYPVIAQYPGVIAQSPVLAPVSVPVPVQSGSPVIEAADRPQIPQQPSTPIQSGGSPSPSSGTTFDDDTVSVEAA